MDQNNNNDFKPKKIKPRKTSTILLSGIIFIIIGAILLILGFNLHGGGLGYTKYNNESEQIYLKDLDLDKTSFENININVQNADIKIVNSTDKFGVDASYYDNFGYKLNYNISNDTLYITDNYDELNTKMRYMNLVPFSSDSRHYLEDIENSSIRVYINSSFQDKYDEVSVKNYRGDIAVDGVNCSNLDIFSQSGGLKLQNINSSTINVHLPSIENGTLKNTQNSTVKNIVCEELNYSEGYGDIKFDNISNFNKSSNINISSESGNIDLKNISADDLIYENRYGDSKFDSVKANFLKINTNNGDFESYNCVFSDTVYNNSNGNSKFRKLTSTSSFECKLQGGEFKIADSKLNDTELKTSSGDIEFSNVVSKGLDLKSEENSNINLNGSFLGDTSIDLRSGSIDFRLLDSITYYNYDISLQVGDLIINNKAIDRNEDGVTEAYQSSQMANDINIKMEEGTINITSK